MILKTLSKETTYVNTERVYRYDIFEQPAEGGLDELRAYFDSSDNYEIVAYGYANEFEGLLEDIAEAEAAGEYVATIRQELQNSAKLVRGFL